MLKFENVKVGSLIRAYDFESMKDHYVDGEVIRTEWKHGAKFLVIMCDYDYGSYVTKDYRQSRIGQEIYVPMETTFDWDDRVIVLDEPQSEVA